MTTSAPVTWHGGKARMASRIIAHFPPHLTYCEPFGGSAAVLLAKQPSEVEIYNDIDGSLANLFQVLRHPVRFRRLLRALENTLYSRSEFALAQQTATDPVEAARRLIVRQRQSFGGMGEQWSFCIKDGNKGGMSSAIRRWRRGIEQLSEVHRRFKSVQIECADWRVVIDRYDAKSSLFFLDPPYHPQTRISGEYKHELSMNDHRELVERLLTSEGMLVLCGYYHQDYARLGQYGWKRIEYDVPAHSSDKRTRRVECLWLSPSVVHEDSRKTHLSPLERMRQGAYHVHKLRIASTTRRVLRAIQKFRLSGEEPTIVAVARRTQLSREHLGRKYKHLFM